MLLCAIDGYPPPPAGDPFIRARWMSRLGVDFWLAESNRRLIGGVAQSSDV
jgi:hypothetical protein